MAVLEAGRAVLTNRVRHIMPHQKVDCYNDDALLGVIQEALGKLSESAVRRWLRDQIEHEQDAWCREYMRARFTSIYGDL